MIDERNPHTTTDTNLGSLADIHDRDPSSLGGPTRTEKENAESEKMERERAQREEKEPEEKNGDPPPPVTTKSKK